MWTSAMVKAKKVKELSAEVTTALGAYAKAEWELIRPHAHWLYKNSRRLWVLEVEEIPACVIGLKQNTLLGTGAEIYFMLCANFNRHVRKLRSFILRALHRMVKLFGSVTVKVDSEFWIGKRFVEFFKFRNQGRACSTETTNYDLYELRASWL
jgi:hypothetical protein